MNTPSANSRKTALRARLLKRRDALSPAVRKIREDIVCTRVLSRIEARSIPSATPRGTVGLYVAFGSELSLESLAKPLEVCGYHLAYPCAFDDRTMEFFMVPQDIPSPPPFMLHPEKIMSRKDEDLLIRRFRLTPVSPREFTVLIVPGAGFDARCGRIGYGAGYYDRYLIRITRDCVVWGAAFDEQLVDDTYAEPHDVRLDSVITPLHLYEGALDSTVE